MEYIVNVYVLNTLVILYWYWGSLNMTAFKIYLLLLLYWKIIDELWVCTHFFVLFVTFTKVKYWTFLPFPPCHQIWFSSPVSRAVLFHFLVTPWSNVRLYYLISSLLPSYIIIFVILSSLLFMGFISLRSPFFERIGYLLFLHYPKDSRQKIKKSRMVESFLVSEENCRVDCLFFCKTCEELVSKNDIYLAFSVIMLVGNIRNTHHKVAVPTVFLDTMWIK